MVRRRELGIRYGAFAFALDWIGAAGPVLCGLVVGEGLEAGEEATSNP